MRVLLADDHAMFCQSVKVLLQRAGIDVVGEAPDGREAVRLAQELRPDVAVLDLSMPRLNGVEAAREIRRLLPDTQAVLLTMYADEACVREALAAGIRGYVLKAQAPADLLDTLREVARGAFYLSPGISAAMADAYQRDGPPSGGALTQRELEVLRMVATGGTTRQIAGSLGLSMKTVESRRSRIMQKLDIHKTAELVRYAVRHGLIKP